MRIYIFRHVRTQKLYKVRAENEATARDKCAEVMDVYMYNLVRVTSAKRENHEHRRESV